MLLLRSTASVKTSSLALRTDEVYVNFVPAGWHTAKIT